MMNKYIILWLLVFVAILAAPIGLSAQKKVKGLPEAFKKPRDMFDPSLGSNAPKRMYNNTSNKSKVNPWIVVSDRDNNPVYKSASYSSEKVRDLEFRKMFYVVDEEEDWIKIADASRVKNLKSKSITPIGWVPKANMLLWSSGLLDRKTGIHKKAFLLNRADNVRNVILLKQDYKELIVDIYRDPEALKKEQKEQKIYTYFFVFKKENEMLLIAEDSDFNGGNIGTNLLGWVSARRVQEWNTRISIAPNFEAAAYNERKNNKALQFRAFGKEVNVKDFVLDDRINGAFWDSDPVKFNPSEMAKSNPRRFKGNVVRFPMFEKGNYGGIDYFGSGVIGSIKVMDNKDGKPIFVSEIPEQKMAEIKKIVSDLTHKNNNINLFFVIEGTNNTFAFKQDILQAIRSLRMNKLLRKAANVNYGALIYRDIPEGNRLTEHKSLTPDLDKIVNFIAQADFVDKKDQDDFTILYHGLHKSLKVAGFNKKDLNIIVIIGSCADYMANKYRKEDARAKNDPTLKENKQPIFQNLADLNAHLYSIQLHHNGILRSGTAFGIQSQKLILETAKYIYVKRTNNHKLNKILDNNQSLNLTEPEMSLPVGMTQVEISGNKPGGIILPMKNESITGNRVLSGLNEMIDKSLNYERVIKEVFDNTYSKGDSLDIRGFSEENGLKVPDLTEGIISVLETFMQESNVEGDFLAKSMDMKLSLYTQVYLPLKAKGAKYPLYSYVLFMPESDLLDYQRLIERNINRIGNSGSYPEKRQGLFEMYMALIKQFAGQDFLRNKKPEDMTRKDVMNIMQGIVKEGLDIDIDLNVRIGGIRDEKEVSDSEIDALIKRFNDINIGLDLIIKKNNRYDFCLESSNDNRYYWLRMDQVF